MCKKRRILYMSCVFDCFQITYINFAHLLQLNYINFTYILFFSWEFIWYSCTELERKDDISYVFVKPSCTCDIIYITLFARLYFRVGIYSHVERQLTCPHHSLRGEVWAHKTSLYLLLFVRGLMSYYRYLCLFTYIVELLVVFFFFLSHLIIRNSDQLKT